MASAVNIGSSSRGGPVVVLLPGPPRELEPMFTAVAQTRLSTRAVPERLYRRVLQVAGRGESHVEELTQPIYTRWEHAEPPVATTVLASPGLVELHLSTRAASQDDAQAVLDAATDELAAVLGNHLFSTDGRSLSEVVGELLQRDGFRVAVGESCTGGLVTARLVDVPGSSRYVETGVIAYSDAVKRTVLGLVALSVLAVLRLADDSEPGERKGLLPTLNRVGIGIAGAGLLA